MTASFPIDPMGSAIVLLGTALAMLARSGPGDFSGMLRHVGALFTPRFNLAAQRAELAAQVSSMQRDGVIRAQPLALHDAEFADANAALCRSRSVEAMVSEHSRHKALRQVGRARARAVLEHGGELAPVMGLAGTLVALAQLPSTGLASDGEVLGAVSVAVVSTLTGLVMAHILLLPLASAIARRGEDEEARRDELFTWLADQLATACPGGTRRAGQAEDLAA